MKVYKHHTLLIILMIAISSCAKFIAVDPPKDQLVTTNVFNRDETAIAALMGMYNTMAGSENMFLSYLIPLYTGLAGDELENWSNLSTHIQLYQNSLNSKDAVSNNIWNTGYFIIYQANSIIEGCQNSSSMSPQVKEQLIGEALFMRAFWNFYLVNFFGHIPLVLSTNYELNANLSQVESLDIYRQVINDLSDAEEKLQVEYLKFNSVPERVRPNKFAAKALLSRVYLYLEDFGNASYHASQVIENKELYETVNIDSVFLSKSKEAIWQLAMPLPSPNNYNTWEGAYFVLQSSPMSNAYNSSTISNSLFEAFELNDLRKTKWLGHWENEQENFEKVYFSNKYKVVSSTSTDERSIVLRVAELFLIRAECRAQQNDLVGAISDLNIIRRRSGLQPLDISNLTTKDNLLDLIMRERRLEFFVEWGHRWMDLKRTGYINKVMPNVSLLKGSTWNDTKSLWPIPQQEIERNKNLAQNEGYN